jgi:ABC-type nitrate/sulfonate/bicarbonate transport system ATPase subunit
MIELKDASLSFCQKTVFSNLNLSIDATGTTALAGPSGCGKTTLMKVIAGLLRLDAGVLSGTKGLRFSIVFQENRLLPWLTALENVSLVSDVQTAHCWLARLGISEAESLKPKALSGGMQRRVAIARALSYPADMLLLDEPFNGLDEENRAAAAEAILAAGLPILVITHHAEEAAQLKARKIIRL